nr:S-Ena type endospore appendage [Pseudalkalibacillus hwajinpoensis]
MPCDCNRLTIWKTNKNLCAFGSITITYDKGCSPIIIVTVKDSDGKNKRFFVPKHNTRVIVLDDLASIDIECNGNSKNQCIGKFVVSFTACCKNACKNNCHENCFTCDCGSCHDSECQNQHDCCCQSHEDNHLDDWDQEDENNMMLKYVMKDYDDHNNDCDKECSSTKKRKNKRKSFLNE